MLENGDIVKIYRLEYEGEDGAGMYGYGPENGPCSEFSAAMMTFGDVFEEGYEGDAAHIVDVHPCPCEDPLLRHLFDIEGTDQEYFYGFQGVVQLLQWVCSDQWLVGLHNLGIVLSIYNCPRESIVHGQKQSLFREHLSKTQHNLIDFFHLQDCVDMT